MRNMPNDAYNNLKWIGMIVLPAFAVGYWLLGEVVEWPRIKEVVGIAVLLSLKINSFVWWSSKKYYASEERFDGYIVLEEDPGGIKKVNMVVEGDPETLLLIKDEITFQVKRH